MKIVVSAGGTGGHLYPALTLAKALQERHDEVLFIGSKDRLEARVVPHAGIPFYGIDVVGMKKTVKGLTTFVIKQHRAVKELFPILKKMQPDVVIGWGGYASFATLRAANKMQIPTIVHEQNATMGRANHYLAMKANYKLVCYPGVVKGELVVGNPRSSEARKYLKKVSKPMKLVLFVMGSQGSSSVNQIIKSYLPLKKETYQVIIIAGKGHMDIYEDVAYPNVKIIEYSDEVMKLFNQADLVITRGGATTLQELASLAKPLIIIPSPYVYKNHQYQNALYFEKLGGAIILDEKQLSKERLNETINAIVLNDFKLESMSKAMERAVEIHALEKILQVIDQYAPSK